MPLVDRLRPWALGSTKPTISVNDATGAAIYRQPWSKDNEANARRLIELGNKFPTVSFADIVSARFGEILKGL